MAAPTLQRVWEIKGIDAFKRSLEKWGQEAAVAAAATLYQEGETIMAEAKRLTPVDTGALRASGHVQPPRAADGGRALVVNLGFGGPAAPYAVYVHENRLAHHNVGQSKFLEQPVLAWTRQAEQKIAARLRGELRRRGLQ